MPSAAHRRHHQLVAPAGAAIDLGAVAELQLARQADAHLAQARARRRSPRSPARLSPGLALTKASSTSSGVTSSGALRLEIFRRDLHGGTRLAHRLEIAARRQAGADAVLVPFVEDQPRRRHQVEHRRRRCCGRAAAPGSGRIPESPSRIAATARAPRTRYGRCAALLLRRSCARRACSQKDGDQDSASR